MRDETFLRNILRRYAAGKRLPPSQITLLIQDGYLEDNPSQLGAPILTPKATALITRKEH